MLITILLASFLVSLISLTGVIILINKRLQNPNVLSLLVSFGAGVMLAAAILDLLPEALALGEISSVSGFILSGIVLFFLLERFVLWFHHHDDLHSAKPTVALIMVGDTVHNFIDGVAIASAFLVDFRLGAVTTLAIVAHEIPQEIADFSILVYSGVPKIKALLANFVSGLASMVGALAGYGFLNNLQASLPMLLGFTAGMFIYIACSDLIPELHQDFKKRRNWAQTLPFLIGIGLIWGIVGW